MWRILNSLAYIEDGGCTSTSYCCPGNTDVGTENGLTASIQCYFRDDITAHRYVPSTRNQHIEAWWSFFARNRSSQWRNYFKDMESEGVLDCAAEISIECLWYCFAELVQNDLDFVKKKTLEDSLN